MSEEKIVNEEIKAEEIISDEELEGVAGGTKEELKKDADRLRRLGYLPKDRDVSKKDINDALWNLGQDIGYDIGSDLHNGDKNVHYIDGHKVYHKDLWDFIYKKLDRRY